MVYIFFKKNFFLQFSDYMPPKKRKNLFIFLLQSLPKRTTQALLHLSPSKATKSPSHHPRRRHTLVLASLTANDVTHHHHPPQSHHLYLPSSILSLQQHQPLSPSYDINMNLSPKCNQSRCSSFLMILLQRQLQSPGIRRTTVLFKH